MHTEIPLLSFLVFFPTHLVLFNPLYYMENILEISPQPYEIERTSKNREFKFNPE